MSKYDFCCFMTVHCLVCLLIFMSALFIQNGYLLLLFFCLITIIPYLAIGHRLQDMGKSGFRLWFYMVAFIVCLLLMCFVLIESLVVPLLEDFGVLTGMYHCQSYGARYGGYLSFLIFLFFTYRWFFGEGDKKANKFGKTVKQKKINKWFMIVPLLFVTFVISYPWYFSLKATVYYAPAMCGPLPDDFYDVDVSDNLKEADVPGNDTNISNNVDASSEVRAEDCKILRKSEGDNNYYIVPSCAFTSDDPEVLSILNDAGVSGEVAKGENCDGIAMTIGNNHYLIMSPCAGW